MEIFDISNYDVSYELSKPSKHEEHIKNILSVINDRSIPEEQKKDVKADFHKVLYLMRITDEPPKIILTPKKGPIKD